MRNTVQRIEKTRGSAAQGRLDGFFTVTPSTGSSGGAKRPAPAKANDKNKKPKSGGSMRGGRR